MTSPYLNRPLRTLLQARADHLITRLHKANSWRDLRVRQNAAAPLARVEWRPGARYLLAGDRKPHGAARRQGSPQG